MPILDSEVTLERLKQELDGHAHTWRELRAVLESQPDVAFQLPADMFRFLEQEAFTTISPIYINAVRG